MVAMGIGRHCERETLSWEINQECLEMEISQVNQNNDLDSKRKKKIHLNKYFPNKENKNKLICKEGVSSKASTPSVLFAGAAWSDALAGLTSSSKGFTARRKISL